jgi:protease-4
MVAFLNWAKSIALGTLNAVVKVALFVILVIVVLMIVGLLRGDGLPDKMVLTADLRMPIADSSRRSSIDFGERQLTVMDTVLALDRASRDSRVKGFFVRLGSGDLSLAQAEEIGAAIKRFRQTGRFVIVHAQGFNSAGLGDYVAAASANEIWMQPRSPFEPAGAGAGAVFLRGLFDKIQAQPQIVKRADYKSAADMFMEKDYTAPDREQTTALLQSWYQSATSGAAADRSLSAKTVAAAFDASPQFAEDVQRARLVDRIGYDDEARAAAMGRAGGAKVVPLRKYERSTSSFSEMSAPRIAVVEAAGEIVDGPSRNGLVGDSGGIVGDDYAAAIHDAAQDSQVKAIVLRVDSPGGSVSASDQILHAVKKAQSSGKPVVVSMGTLAASGGYYISCSADRIVAEPGTITGSIGVLTGKVSFGKTAGLIGLGVDQIGVGKNALMESAISPYTPEQWANLNRQVDAIYTDFMQKVATGRKLPLDKVQAIAKGRIWSGSDARSRGLVDELGGFWTAVEDAKKLAHISASERVAFKIYPKKTSFLAAISSAFSSSAAGVRALQGLAAIEQLPFARAVIRGIQDTPRGEIEMKATNLPVN